MQIINRLLLIVLLFGFLQHLHAEELELVETPEQKFYVGINPLALSAFLPNMYAPLFNIQGQASNHEFGISLYGGMYFTKEHSIEMRFSTGPGNTAIWDTQLQFGYIWYPLEQFFDWNGGLCSGFMLRQFFWNNRITDYVIFNLTPELLIGWRFKGKSLAFDLRAGWNFASITWSTMPYTKASIGWTPFNGYLPLPMNLTLSIGVAYMFN
jgi:hypothetical protein